MANKGAIPKGGKPGEQNKEKDMASERESRGADNRDTRMGTENRGVNEKRENTAWHNDLRIHAKNSDDFRNPFDNLYVDGDKYSLGWFPDRATIPPGYRKVPYDCLDDEVRGNYDSMHKGTLGNIAMCGDQLLHAILKETRQSQLAEAESKAAINMKNAMEASAPASAGKAALGDLGSGKEQIKLDG